MKNFRKGFTLLEILLVVGIIAILAGIVIVAINPSKQLAQVRNTERKSDLKQIANAITQFYIDHSYYPTSLTGELTEICDTGASSTPSGITCTDMIDLSELVPTYLTAIPKDPSATTTNYAGYKVIKTGNQIGLSAPAELNQAITIGTVPEVVVDACEISGNATDPDCWSIDNIADGYIKWSTENVNTGAQSSVDGRANSDHIMANHANPNPWATSNYPAVAVCAQYNDGVHPVGTWFLPSEQQLTDAYSVVSGFTGEDYWSSTEYAISPTTLARGFYLLLGRAFGYPKSSLLPFARCLR